MWSTVKPSARPSPPIPKVSVTTPKQITTSHTLTTTSTSQNPIYNIPPLIVKTDDDIDDDEIINKKPDLPLQPIPEEITTLQFTTITPNNRKVTCMYQISHTILASYIIACLYYLTIAETSVSNTYVPSPSVMHSGSKDSIVDYCSPMTIRSIYWNWTKINATNTEACPGGTTGYARWKCIEKNSIPTWSPQTPDLSQCRSVWLTSLEQRILSNQNPLVSITNDLAQVTSSKTLYGGDMMITTKIIQKMAHKMSQDIQTFPDTRQREAIVTEMLNDVVKTGSNLLDSSQHPSWHDLSYSEQMRVATSLLIGLEENAFLLADTVMREKTVNQKFKNISKYHLMISHYIIIKFRL